MGFDGRGYGVIGADFSVYAMIHRFIEASQMDRGQVFGTQRQVGRAAVLTIPSPSTQPSFRSGLDHMRPQTYTRSMSGTSLLENGLLACSNVMVSSLGSNSLLMTTVTASEFLIAEMVTGSLSSTIRCLSGVQSLPLFGPTVSSSPHPRVVKSNLSIYPPVQIYNLDPRM